MFDVDFEIAEGPLDAGEVVAKDERVPVHVVVVAEGAVEDAAFFPVAGPSDAEVFVLAFDAAEGHVGFLGVETEEHVDGFGIVGVLELIDLLFEVEVFAFEHGDEGVGFLAGFDLDADVGACAPRVSVEVSVDHFSVFGPIVEGVCGGVDTDESAARLDEFHEVFLEAFGGFGGGFLFVVGHFVEVTFGGHEGVHGGAEEADGVELAELVDFEIGKVVGDDGGEGAGFFTEFGEGEFAGGDGCVAEAGGLGKDQEFAVFFGGGVGFLGDGLGDFFRGFGRGLFAGGVLGDDEECCEGEQGRWYECLHGVGVAGGLGGGKEQGWGGNGAPPGA